MTDLEIDQTLIVIGSLWPQLATDLADNDELRRTWRKALKPHSLEHVCEAMRAHREQQSKPIRPEPGNISQMIRTYCKPAESEEVFVLLVDGPGDTWHQFCKRQGGYVPWPGDPDDAQQWCDDQPPRTGLTWEVFRGTRRDMMKRVRELKEAKS